MMETIKIIVSVIVILVFVELLDLPEWIGRKFKGDITKNEMKEEIESLKKKN